MPDSRSPGQRAKQCTAAAPSVPPPSVPVRSVHQVGQIQLTLPRERAEVFVALEEVQQLGGVGHPEGESPGAGLLSLHGAKCSSFSVTSQSERVGFLRHV